MQTRRTSTRGSQRTGMLWSAEFRSSLEPPCATAATTWPDVQLHRFHRPHRRRDVRMSRSCNPRPCRWCQETAGDVKVTKQDLCLQPAGFSTPSMFIPIAPALFESATMIELPIIYKATCGHEKEAESVSACTKSMLLGIGSEPQWYAGLSPLFVRNVSPVLWSNCLTSTP